MLLQVIYVGSHPTFSLIIPGYYQVAMIRRYSIMILSYATTG